MPEPSRLSSPAMSRMVLSRRPWFAPCCLSGGGDGSDVMCSPAELLDNAIEGIGSGSNNVIDGSVIVTTCDVSRFCALLVRRAL